MPRVAEVKTEFTADGAKAQVAIRQLEKSIENLANKAGRNLGNRFTALFSVAAINGFVRAMDRAALSMAEMVDKIREGKKSIDDINKIPQVREQMGFASGYQDWKKQFKVSWDLQMTELFRGIIAGIGRTPGLGNLAFMSENFHDLYTIAEYGDLGAMDAAEAQGKLSSKQKTRRRGIGDPMNFLLGAFGLSKEKLIELQNDFDGKEIAQPKETHIDRFQRSFSNLQKLGAFAYDPNGIMRVQQQSLQQLIEIKRILITGTLPNSGRPINSIYPD